MMSAFLPKNSWIHPSVSIQYRLVIYFASAAVAVDTSHMTASSSASWSRFSPPSNFVNGHMSTMWLVADTDTGPKLVLNYSAANTAYSSTSTRPR